MKSKKRQQRLETRRHDHAKTIEELVKRPEWDEERARKAFKCPGSLKK
jgi:hypothetical protein